MSKKRRIIFIHGSGHGTVDSIWFPDCKRQFEKAGHTVEAVNFPDIPNARAKYWLPFLRHVLKPDRDTVLFGYSSGAVAAMRYAEEHRILGSVLIAAYYTYEGAAPEENQGYFTKPWRWNKILSNQKFILQFASSDDPFIPISQARYINHKLKTDYHEFDDEGHFFGGRRGKTTFPEVVKALIGKLEDI